MQPVIVLIKVYCGVVIVSRGVVIANRGVVENTPRVVYNIGIHCGVLFWGFALCNDFNAKVAVI